MALIKKDRPSYVGSAFSRWPTRARTWTLLDQNQTCCQLHHRPKWTAKLVNAFENQNPIFDLLFNFLHSQKRAYLETLVSLLNLVYLSNTKKRKRTPNVAYLGCFEGKTSKIKEMKKIIPVILERLEYQNTLIHTRLRQ